MQHLYPQIESIFLKHQQQSLFDYWLHEDDTSRERLLLIFTISKKPSDALWQEVLDLLLTSYNNNELQQKLNRNIRQLQRKTRRNKY